MGGEPYDYIVPYERDIQGALDKLRMRVFRDGAYNGAESRPSTPEAALQMAGADGTRSILDIRSIGEEPAFFTAAPLTPEELRRYFGTEKPTRASLRNAFDLWDDMERGMARYILLYEGDEPREIFFGGYSFD
jgi:hypothetical protein